MCHVLIIEDEPLVAMDLEMLLASAGATSFSFAQSQPEAVEMALAHPPAFITSDVRLADGTGPLAVFDIHKVLGPIPVLFITGTPDACHPRELTDLVLTKPFDRTAVIRAFHVAQPTCQAPILH
jgi:CheY-like chemotaxis protein